MKNLSTGYKAKDMAAKRPPSILVNVGTKVLNAPVPDVFDAVFCAFACEYPQQTG